MRRIRYYYRLIVAYVIPYECYGYMQMMSGDCNMDKCNRCKQEYIRSIKTEYRQNKRV